MALLGTLEAEVEIKCDGNEILHLLGGTISHPVPNLVPEHMPQVDLHEGDWGDHGSIKFIPKGETNVVKTTLEYEKQNEDVPPPDKYMNFLVNKLVKDVDAKLVQGH
ncbi:MLP-like protein 34 [Actinidia eriantha]|uniref:MLP-like protein 34 n=1 Tax=Actinidia eriantha TaxID=165200 RepID=UPI00258D55A6|nr:MLP-like protein 34 [Actinidia eriantha]